jgi:hypothetical protein
MPERIRLSLPPIMRGVGSDLSTQTVLTTHRAKSAERRHSRPGIASGPVARCAVVFERPVTITRPVVFRQFLK